MMTVTVLGFGPRPVIQTGQEIYLCEYGPVPDHFPALNATPG